jgi:ribose 5-phosphate isomerase B
MKIALGCDHRGYLAKQNLSLLLTQLGHTVEDFGCHSPATVDYPDIARPVALSVAEQECELGILIDGNGMGMCMAANKIPGIRAAVVHDEFTTHTAREQHHCNIICLAADLDGRDQFDRSARAFIETALAFGRHARRVEKIMLIEQIATTVDPIAASA